MFHSRTKVAAAVLAFGALITAPAMAGPSKNGGGGGCGGNCGGGGGGFHERIICVVNGRRFEVSDVRECYPKRKVYYGYTRYHFERHVTIKRKIIRQRPVCGCAYTQGGYGGGYAGGYTGGGYYSGYATGGSTAARMQAERRSESYGMTDGGVYVGPDEGSYEQPPRHLKKRRYSSGYEAGYTYDPGYVIHYGPTISKDGGY
jgi:hypothetical protein